MDSDLVMSATAGATVREGVLRADYWRAFVPAAGPSDTLAQLSAAIEKPHLSMKSTSSPGTTLRARFEGRLGVAAVIDRGEVRIAFPFVKGGCALDLKIVDLPYASNDLEGWVVAEHEGVRFGFYDTLHSVGKGRLRVGENHRFVVNAFALSLRKIETFSCSVDPDGDLLPLSLSNLRSYLPRKSNHDRGIFQSPIDGTPGTTHYEDREFVSLPISLGDEDGARATVDLWVSPELVDRVGSPLRKDDEVAGIVWIQGYAVAEFAP